MSREVKGQEGGAGRGWMHTAQWFETRVSQLRSIQPFLLWIHTLSSRWTWAGHEWLDGRAHA